MVFGFGEGSIDLMLGKTNFAYGETIQGKLNLKLKKEKQARQLRVRIEATFKRSSGGPALINTGQKRSSETQVLYQTETVLDGEKLYSPPGKEYEFKIQVPQKSALPPMPQGGLATAIGAMNMLSGVSVRVEWRVIASLDIPGAMDIKKSVNISVQ
jgi:hypothetical protein